MRGKTLFENGIGLSLGLVFFSALTIPATQDTISNNKAQSSITYVLVHPFHTVHGVSNQASSTIDFNRHNQQVMAVQVTVPVKSFDSGNKTRDKDMLKVTNAVRHPEVTFKSTRITPNKEQLHVEGQLTFHGVTKEIVFDATQQRKEQTLVVDGQLIINLEEYDIKRPSIFGMKVKDALTVRFHMEYPVGKAGT